MRYINSQPFIFLGIFVLVHALFLLNMDLLPFIDLPNHLAESTIFKYHNSSLDTLGQYYQPVPWYFPNTFHVVFCSLFPSVELGNQIFFILYISLLVFSMLMITKALGGNVWYGALAVLFVYNFNVAWGFTGFAIAIPITLILFYVLLKEVHTERLLYTICVGVLLVLLFLMHAQMALFGLLLSALMLLYRYHKSWKKILLKVFIVPAPLIILLIAWWRNRGDQEEESTFSYLLNYYRSDYLGEFMKRGKIFCLDNYHLREGSAGIAIAVALFSLTLIPLVYMFIKNKQLVFKDFLKQNSYAVILFVSACSCFIFLPNKLPGQWPIYERLSPLVILSFIILGSLLLKDLNVRWIRIYVITAALVYSLLWLEYIYTFNKENRNFRPQFFSKVGYPSKTAGLMYSYLYRGRPIYIHFPNYFLVWKKGIVASKMIDYRFGVVRRGMMGQQIPDYWEWVGKSNQFNTLYNASIDYLLVRGHPATTEMNFKFYSLVREDGPWRLYRNNILANK